MKAFLIFLVYILQVNFVFAGDVLVVDGRSYDAEILQISNPIDKKVFTLPLFSSEKETKSRVISASLSSINNGSHVADFNLGKSTLDFLLTWQKALNYSFAAASVKFEFNEDPANNVLSVTINCPSEYKLARRSWSLTGGVPTWDFMKDFSKVCEKDIFPNLIALEKTLKVERQKFKEKIALASKQSEKLNEISIKNKIILDEESSQSIAMLSKMTIGLEDRCEIIREVKLGFFESLSEFSKMDVISKGEYHKGQLKCQFGGNVFLNDLNKAGWMVISEQENKLSSEKVQIVYLVRKSR